MKLHLDVILTIILMANKPDKNALITPQIIAKILIFAKFTEANSNTTEPSIMGILIKNEKSAEVLPFAPPSTTPPKMVDPLRLMPGKIATACVRPISRAVLWVIFCFFIRFLLTKLIENKIRAVIKKPKHKNFVSSNKLLTKSFSSSITNTAGKHEIIKLSTVLWFWGLHKLTRSLK